jgi:hypothetical protein
MHADSHFVIGHTHVNGGKPCQDYAVSGDLPDGGAYAVVADGCSSGGRTDVGARLVSLATEQVFRHAPADWTAEPLRAAVRSRQQFTFRLAPKLLGLDQEDLVATCGYIFANGRTRVVQLHGDGVIAELEGGHLRMTRVEWRDNTPVYPVYMLDGYQAFIAHHGGDASLPAVTVTTSDTSPGMPDQMPVQWPIQYGLEGIYRRPLHARRVAVFTDGVTQIDGVDWRDAVQELMNFKSLTGEFAKRRLNRLIRDWHSAGRGPLDDLAYAVVDLTPPEPQEEQC